MATTFEQYNNWRQNLLELLGKAAESADNLSLNEKATRFRELQDQLKNDTFKIQIVGTVKNGKSSFTNALIGQNILPVDDIPCTAVVSEVKYGENKRAIVHFCSPMPTGLLEEIPKATRKYIEKYNYGKDASGSDVQIPPLEIPYEQLDKYIAIPAPTFDILTDQKKFKEYRDKIDQESPYDVCELYFHTEILKNGVELVDSPGLNESPKRTQVTLSYLERADAVIFLTDATHPLTQDEQETITERLLKLGYTDLIMVGNKIDLITDRERQMLYIQAAASGYTNIKEAYGVSSKEALEGIKNNDKDLLDRSGIPQFKVFLTDYLTRKKGFVKIKKPANQLKNILVEDLIKQEIPRRLKSLDTDAKVLQKRLNDATPRLTSLKAKREDMVNSMNSSIPLAIIPIQAAMKAFYDELQNEIQTWVNGFTPQTNPFIFVSKRDKENIAKETLEFVKGKTSEKFETWNKDIFQKVVEEQGNLVFGRLKENIDGISEDIVAIDNILKGLNAGHVSDINIAERVAGIAAMLFLPMGRAGGELFAGGFDLSRFMKTFVVDLGVGLGVGLIATLVWPPLGLIAAIVGAITGLLKGGAGAIATTKQQIANHIINSIQENADQQIKDVINKVRGTFDSIKESVLKGVDTEINTVEEQVKQIEEIVRNGQQSISVQRSRLQSTKASLETIVFDTDKLLGELNDIN